MLEVGQLSPSFALHNQEDHVIKLDRLTSQFDHVVVYFFPQAGAPGCTREAIGFRDLMPEFNARSVRIIGICPSPAVEVREFARTNNLNFDIVSDPSRTICAEWDARRGDHIARMTFVLNQLGRIIHIFPRVDVFKHPAEVLAFFGPAPAVAQPPAQGPTPPSAPAVALETVASSAPAPAAPTTAASPPAELLIATVRAALHLLLAYQRAGGQVPADVVELCKRVTP